MERAGGSGLWTSSRLIGFAGGMEEGYAGAGGCEDGCADQASLNCGGLDWTWFWYTPPSYPIPPYWRCPCSRTIVIEKGVEGAGAQIFLIEWIGRDGRRDSQVFFWCDWRSNWFLG